MNVPCVGWDEIPVSNVMGMLGFHPSLHRYSEGWGQR